MSGRDLVVEWDEFGQGYRADGHMVVCICGAESREADWSAHNCIYDLHPEEEACFGCGEFSCDGHCT